MNLENCPLCSSKAREFKYHCSIQNIKMYRFGCGCDLETITFATKNPVAGRELWNSFAKRLTSLKKSAKIKA